jgi:tripartite-type tricarboxylate transporter receptor subunit TctC
VVAKSPPDGHTLLMTDVSFSISPALYKQLPYDPLKDLQPVTLVNLVPDVLVVGPEVPVRNLKDLIELAKKEPGKLAYASAGNGTLNHLAPDMLRAQAGIQVLHVPYNGALAALNDVMAGRAQFYIGALNSTLPLIKAGKVRAIAMTGARRSRHLPDVPTIQESGLPGYDVAAWYGLLAPAGTPRSALDRISRDVVKLLRDPEVKAAIETNGDEVVGSTPAEFGSFIQAELAKWRKAAQDAGATIQ